MKESFEYIELENIVNNLKGLEVNPPDEVWQRLDDQLGHKPPRKGPGPLYGGLITLAFFSMLTLMEGSVFYLFQQQIPRPNQTMMDDMVHYKAGINLISMRKSEISYSQSHSKQENHLSLLKEESYPEAKDPEVEETLFPTESIPLDTLIPFKEIIQDKAKTIPDSKAINKESKTSVLNIIEETGPKKKSKQVSVQTRAKKKKKRGGHLYLPPLFKKSWQRGKNWDYQIGLEGGLVNWRNFRGYSSEGGKIGIQGELAFSPYFRIATGASLVRVSSPHTVIAYRDSISNNIIIDNNFLILRPISPVSVIHMNINNTYIDVPIFLKTFLPLRKKRIEPYLGIGTVIEIATLRRNIIDLNMMNTQTNIQTYSRHLGFEMQRFKFLAEAGAEIKVSRRMNLQVGLGYQRERVRGHTIHLETSVWFTGNRGYFRWRKEQ